MDHRNSVTCQDLHEQFFCVELHLYSAIVICHWRSWVTDLQQISCSVASPTGLVGRTRPRFYRVYELLQGLDLAGPIAGRDGALSNTRPENTYVSAEGLRLEHEW